MEKEVIVLKTERLNLREIREEDAELLVHWRSDPETYRYFKSPHRITMEEHDAWYKNRYLTDNRIFNMIGEERTAGKPVGTVGMMLNDADEIEVSYLIAPEERHKGYAKEAVSGLIQYIRNQWPEAKVFAEIHRENHASAALAERLGFHWTEEKGCFRRYLLERIK